MYVDGVRAQHKTLQQKDLSQTFVGFAEKMVAIFIYKKSICVHC